VVLLIIGIMIVGAVLSVHMVSSADPVEKERDRIVAAAEYLRDQAALQNREFGIRCYEGGYEFMVYDAHNNVWQTLEDDNITRAHKLPAGVEMTVQVEGRKIVLPTSQADESERKPQVLLYSSGEMNLFELDLESSGHKGASIKPGSASDNIEIGELAAAA